MKISPGPGPDRSTLYTIESTASAAVAPLSVRITTRTSNKVLDDTNTSSHSPDPEMDKEIRRVYHRAMNSGI